MKNRITHSRNIILKKSFKKGSSLVVTILVMSILITLTLGLSGLVTREIRQTSDLISSGQAYYSAEAGIENALWDMNQKLPGYDTLNPQSSPDNHWKMSQNGSENPKFKYDYRILGSGDAFPYIDNDAYSKQFLYENKPEDTYNVLPLHQTVTIPLFTDDGKGSLTDVTEFIVDYYVKFTLPGEDPAKLKNYDILRWKLFGNPTGNATVTDAISDFYPVSADANAQNPVCIGTDAGLQRMPNGQSCSAATAQQKTGVPVWSLARECYLSEAGNLVAGGQKIANNCSMATFISKASHERNYLTLTNIVNPDIIGLMTTDAQRQKMANIYYRVRIKTGEKIPREYTHVSANGYSFDGKVRQSIDVNYGLNSFLPVFNFSLYNTDTTTSLAVPKINLPNQPVIHSVLPKNAPKNGQN